MWFLAVFSRADEEVFLLSRNSSHIAGLHGVIRSSREGTSRQADEAGIDIEFCLSASVRGRVVAVFISWLTLCSAPALKEGITVTGTTFTWRKSHGVCGTPAAPLPHLRCFSAAPVLTEKNKSFLFVLHWHITFFINIKSEIVFWRPEAAMPYLTGHVTKGWKESWQWTWRQYWRVDEQTSMHAFHWEKWLDNSALYAIIK